ncbi:ketopantoate reductase family protein [Brytella acorum]|uniref:NAD(P)-binding domain-containing protein n=1 Tax=Brytella acorum TaxID=2959299 RepID=A0AA35Y1U0_9PROT|nr:2-dehydropantoate 2-reductase N-terminal domain-containing protein [Brytella acorum]MDF3625978.1 2-dehydropantoate 2-reductase N-terminal domain-containing protein [Brytella acorum]CAI9119203.1 NAD(P)-binding domain-containing protein [Brytella acorum]
MSISSDKSSPLRIAILGGGRIGSAFAFHFARNARHEVTIIARPNSARLAQLRRDEGIVTTTHEHASAIICDTLDENIPYDFVLVTVKDYQVRALLPALTRCAARKIHFMFMTFEPDRLRQAVSPERAILGMPFLQSDFDANGHLKISIGKRETLTDDPEWAHLFRAAGLPARHEPQMALWLRCHVPLGVAFESVAVAAVQRGRGASWSRARTLALGVRACFAMIRSQGYEIYPKDKARLEKLPVSIVTTMLWGLSRIPAFRTLLATGKTECSALVDDMLASAPTTAPSIDLHAIRAMKPE